MRLSSSFIIVIVRQTACLIGLRDTLIVHAIYDPNPLESNMRHIPDRHSGRCGAPRLANKMPRQAPRLPRPALRGMPSRISVPSRQETHLLDHTNFVSTLAKRCVTRRRKPTVVKKTTSSLTCLKLLQGG